MPRYKITDDQGQVHRVEAADPESAKKLFLNGGSPMAPAIKPKGDPLTGPAFIKPEPEGEIRAPTLADKANPSTVFSKLTGAEPGAPKFDTLMKTAGLLLPTPATAAGAAAGAIPFAGGRIAQAGKRIATGAGLGGILGAGKALLTGEEVAPETAVGALGGGVGGLAAGATKAPLMPNKATQQATRGAQALLKGEEWSPNVRSLINEKDPASLYSRHTLASMQQRASGNIRNTLDALEQSHPGGVPIPSAHLAIPGLPQSPIAPTMSIKEAQGLIKDLRKQGKTSEAFQIERDLVNGLGQTAGPQYRATMDQYARDARLIDYVTGVQKRVKLPGGVNPQDFPAAAQAEKALGGGSNQSAGYHAGMFLAHPTSPYGIAHGVGSLGAMMGKGPVDPAKITPPMGPLRQGAGMVLPPVAGGLAGQQVQGIFGLGSTE